jgi:hypothetical protein
MLSTADVKNPQIAEYRVRTGGLGMKNALRSANEIQAGLGALAARGEARF